MTEVLVVAEHRRGKLREITLEMLSLAQEFSASPRVLLMGSGVEELAARLSALGSEVLLMDDPRLAEYGASEYLQAVQGVIEEEEPQLVLVGHTAQGVDWAPALAVEMGLPYIPEIIGLKLEDERYQALRQIYSGKVNEVVSCSARGTSLVTVREAAFEALEKEAQGSIQKLEAPLKEEDKSRSFVEYQEAEVGEVDISQSEQLIAIGRGLREEKNLPLVEELAEKLGAHLCGSRPAVDNGWLTADRQVGVSGKNVKPRLYLALGISGAFQHTTGMKGAQKVVAINKDPEAPIFAHSDYGIVDDLFKVLPKLTEMIEELQE